MKDCVLIIVSGHPASGKTTLSKKISEEFNLPIVSADGIKETFWELFGPSPDFELNDKIGKACFEILYYFINSILSKGKSLIVEAHFSPKINNKRINRIGKKFNAKLLQIYCNCDKNVLEKRFKERIIKSSYHQVHKHTIKLRGLDWVLNNFKKEKKRLEIKGKTYDLDTTDPKNVDYEKLFEFIKDNL